MVSRKSVTAALIAIAMLAGCNEDESKKATTGTFPVPAAAATEATKPLMAGPGEKLVVDAGRGDNDNKLDGDAGDKGIADRRPPRARAAAPSEAEQWAD